MAYILYRVFPYTITSLLLDPWPSEVQLHGILTLESHFWDLITARAYVSIMLHAVRSAGRYELIKQVMIERMGHI